MGGKELSIKLSNIERSVEEMKIDISYLKNHVDGIIDFMNSNQLRNELLQRDMVIYELLNEIKILLNEILNILLNKK
ncbi:MAG: hypothetical protein QW743_07775 [Candidatus Methanomethylicia archaeon]